jgi:hypothetical protein
MKSPFELLIRRPIIDILIGDKNLDGETSDLISNRTMPYLTGSKICDISTMFGYPQTGTGASRWTYMSDLLKYSIEKKN